MKFNVNIKNFGKIQNANIVLSNFTVIAGKNGCGKSFVTRAFYSFFNTINKDHLTKDLLKYIGETDYFLNDILSN
ncbi:AAA family ATPase, partial [Gilliamella apis]